MYCWYKFRPFLNEIRDSRSLKCVIFFSDLPLLTIRKSTNRSLEKTSPARKFSFRALLDPWPMHKMWEIVPLLATFFLATQSSRPMCFI